MWVGLVITGKAAAASAGPGKRASGGRIAAEVAKLAMQLEGPNSPIEAMLAAEPAVPAKPAKPANGIAASGANGAAAGSTVPVGGGTLAERIRALQSHASRARQQQPG
jgi:hypothetical protein